MMIPVVVVLLLLVLAGVLLLAVRQWIRDRARTEAALESDRTETLEYVVPEGQDPAVVLVALEQEGFTPAADSLGRSHLLRIHCPAGLERDRAQVRAVISRADSTAIEHGARIDVDPVVFEDER